MNRRTFLKRAGATIAALAAGLGLVKKANVIGMKTTESYRLLNGKAYNGWVDRPPPLPPAMRACCEPKFFDFVIARPLTPLIDELHKKQNPI